MSVYRTLHQYQFMYFLVFWLDYHGANTTFCTYLQSQTTDSVQWNCISLPMCLSSCLFRACKHVKKTQQTIKTIKPRKPKKLIIQASWSVKQNTATFKMFWKKNTNSWRSATYGKSTVCCVPKQSLLKGKHILRVSLGVIENDKHGWIRRIVSGWVVQDGSLAQRQHSHVLIPLCGNPNQHFAQIHIAIPWCVWRRVGCTCWVIRIDSKVHTLAMHSGWKQNNRTKLIITFVSAALFPKLRWAQCTLQCKTTTKKY